MINKTRPLRARKARGSAAITRAFTRACTVSSLLDHARLLLAGTGATLLLTLAPLALATNGYFSHGFGTKSKGLAGAGSALPQDALSSVVNPAGVAHVGTRLDIGAALFAPQREYSQRASSSLADPSLPPLPIGSAPDFTGTVESRNELFVIPHFGYTRELDQASGIGIALYGNGGMNTEFDVDDTSYGIGTFGSGSDTGVDLMQLFANVRYARRVSDNLTLGAGAILAVQRFRAEGIAPLGMLVADGNPDALSDNGYDYSYGVGAQFGGLWSISDRWTAGASYQTRLYMTEFDDYQDLFAERGDFDIPATATLGIDFTPRSDVHLVADVQYIMYHDIKSLGNPMSDYVVACFGGQSANCLGGRDGTGFGWDSMTVYKVGAQWDVTRDWTVRAGYSLTDNPVPSSGVLFNVLAPAVTQEHITFGFTRRFGNERELNLSLMHAPEHNMNCGCSLPMTGGLESINIAMSQWELELSYAWRF